MLMYLHKAPHRPWPRADKFAEFAQKTFPEPPLFLMIAKGAGAAKTAEMNLLKHMMYSQ